MIENKCRFCIPCRPPSAILYALFSLLLFHIHIPPAAAQVHLRGQVIDAETGKGIQGVTVALRPEGPATVTDSAGNYQISSRQNPSQIEFRTLGYLTLSQSIEPSMRQLDVRMEVDVTQLSDIVINQRGKYKNRDNPAVALLRKVIEAKPRHRLGRFAYEQINTYEKNMLALSEVPGFIQKNWVTKGYSFIFDNIDTTLIPGYRLLPALLEETSAIQYGGTALPGTRTQVLARKMTELNPRFVDNTQLRSYLSFFQEELDLYSKDIKIAGKAFLSPIADSGPYFYRYFITDTLDNQGKRYAEVTFVPRNRKSYLFSGKMQIDLENYGILQAHLQVDQTANFNWVKRLDIDFNFRLSPVYGYLPEQAEFAMLATLPRMKTGIYTARTLVYDRYKIQDNLPVDFKPPTNRPADTSDVYWETHRPLPLSPVERKTYINMDSLKNNRAFKRTLSWAAFISDGFISAGPIDVGPWEYAYSFNDLEGSRIRLGAKTGRSAERPYYLEGYLAYGTRDKRLKYFMHGAYSLNKQAIARFPAHYIEGSYQQDVRQPGYEMSYLNGDSFFQSFRRGEQVQYLFKQRARLRYMLEFKNQISLRTHISRLHQQPAYGLLFNTGGTHPDTLHGITHTELGINLRWAPHEQILQKQLERSNIPNRYPIINLQYSLGIPGILGGNHSFHSLKTSINKRFFFPIIGISDVHLGAGYIWGQVPYLLLDIPNADLSYLLNPDSYQLLNEMEFVNDQYIKLDLQHNFEGLVLNRIPLVKKLGWREHLGFKLLYGGLRKENNPEYNSQSIRFPSGESGQQNTYAMSNKPYMEFSVGIENIFNFLQVRYIKRLSYLDHPSIDKQGFRFSIKFDF